MDRAAGQFRAAAQEAQFDQEGGPDDLAADGLDELDRGRGRAAGREHVVDDQDLRPLRERVGVRLDGVRAVLESVGRRLHRARELPLLADGDHARAEAVGDRRREEEAARLDAGDDLHALPDKRLGQAVDHFGE